jgi:plastocyanin domain-containing protein
MEEGHMSRNGKKSVRTISKKVPRENRTETAKPRPVSLNIESATGESAYGLGILGLLFREILQQIPPEQADKLDQAHPDGKIITMNIADRSRGAGSKRAFQWTISEDMRRP